MRICLFFLIFISTGMEGISQIPVNMKGFNQKNGARAKVKGNQLQVQQLNVDGNGVVQQVELRPGVPVILSGFDRREDEFERRRLTPDAPLLAGGLDKGGKGRLTTVVLITAQVEDGL